MEKDYKDKIIEVPLEDLIKVNEDAAKRTRWTTIVLVLATVIIGIGFYNSTKWSFAVERLEALKGFENMAVNNLSEAEEKPMLDALFGKYDFRETNLKKDNFIGLRRFICDNIYTKRELVITNKFDSATGNRIIKNITEIKDAEGNPIEKYTDSLEKYLFDNFNSETKQLIKTECHENLVKKKESVFENEVNFKYLTSDLNRILKSKFLYNKIRFENIKIEKDETRKLIAIATHKPTSVSEISITDANSNSSLSNTAVYPKNSNTNTNVKNPNLTTNANKTDSLSTIKLNNSNSTSIIKNEEAQTKNEEVEMTINDKEINWVRLNRLLLEAAFPKEIYESKDIITDGNFQNIKQLAAYIAFDDNVQFIEIPFFGNAIDVNDLGWIGGISLIIILLLLRFSLSREIKNLNLSFRQAFYRNKLRAFYHSLAMRLILVVPNMEGEIKNQALSAAAKYICLLPLIVICLAVGYDDYSIYRLGVYESDFVQNHLYVEYVCVIIILYLSLRCIERLTHLDEIWEDYWLIVKKSPDELISDKSKLPISEEIIGVVHRRIDNKAIEGRFPNSESAFVRWLGRVWFIRLFCSRKNIARLIPSKFLSNLIGGKTQVITQEKLNELP